MSFRPLFGRPRLLQDWGTEQHERETHWTSLFYDLMIVAALNAIAEPFEEAEEEAEEHGESRMLLSMSSSLFVLTPIRHLWLNAILQFVSVVNPWNALNEYTSMMDDGSVLGHLLFFVHCTGVAVVAAGCVGSLEENYKVLATGIILAKVGMIILYLRPLYYLPRARTSVSLRCLAFVVNIGLMLYGMSLTGDDAFERFRIVLIVGTLWDWIGIFFVACLKQADRVPIHIQSYSDRIKEVTMVIFGEAIFAIILQPMQKAKPETHFYLALACTLWLIYAMALQEFHILPDEHDHALRRSIFFSILWYYSQFWKQICLLGTSIGIKRAHLLMFQAPTEPIDPDTRNLIVWGLSLTMLAVVMIRSYSFGWGRHPSKDDPPDLYRLKVTWWAILGFSCLLPQIVDWTLLQVNSTPLFVLVSLGIMMLVIIVFETAMSNLAAEHMRRMMRELSLEEGGHDDGEPGELTYLRQPSSERNQSSSH